MSLPSGYQLYRALFRPVFLARLIFVLLATLCGMLLAQHEKQVALGEWILYERWLYSALGFSFALVITLVERATDAISSHKILMAAFGMTAGLIFSNLFYRTIPLVAPERALMVCNLLFGYFGIVLAIKHAERFHLSRLKFFLSPAYERPKVLDSSVIIDGRIQELIDLQVIQGGILVPHFVLAEIQAIADSPEASRKARGRRGLEALERLRDTCKTLDLIDKDYSEIKTVDQKLVALCREMDGDLLTNDYNLQKIAHLHRITVLNINEIANALRPTVFIGETFDLSIVREGREPGQGVGYLEDGTMVVVDGASSLMGKDVSVTVSSILQTSSGRLVFARLTDLDHQEHA